MKRTLVLTLLALIAFSGLGAQTHDVAAVAFISPPRLVLRWTEIEPWVVVGNFGEESETFNVILNIYDDDDTRIYNQIISGMYEPPGPGELAVFNFPCWEPGELYEEGVHYYYKELIVLLDGDENPSNDTLVEYSFVGCDDTVGYEWNYTELNTDSFCTKPEGFWKTYGTSYQFDAGVLVKGARVYMGNTESMKAEYGLTDNPRLEVWVSDGGCGQPVSDGIVGYGITESYQDGWNHAFFAGKVGPRVTDLPGNAGELVEDLGIWVPADPEDGNIWFAVTTSGYGSDGHGTGCWVGAGFLIPPEPAACYGGPASSRSAVWQVDYNHSWQGWEGYMNEYSIMVEPIVHLGFNPENPQPLPPCYYDEPHDLSIYRIEEPDKAWVEDGVPITAKLALGNFGRRAESDVEHFPVKLFVVDVDSRNKDTVYAETVTIDQIGWFGDPNDGLDTMLVEMLPWTPEGICEDWAYIEGYPIPEELVGAHYELIGLVRLGEVGPDESDHCPYNDTCRLFFTCLLSHDVGVVDLINAEGYEWNGAGTEFTFVATVENFGFNEEHNVDVDIEIVDVDITPDSLVWHTVETISHLDWRGNDLGNPYIVNVTYPTWTMPGGDLEGDCFVIECRTEMEGDDCPVNDEVTGLIGYCGAIEERTNAPQCFSLEVVDAALRRRCGVSFAIPNSSFVKITVYDINGRLVKSLVDGYYEAGYHERVWNGIDDAGRKVSAGIYLVRMEAGGFDEVKKLVIID